MYNVHICFHTIKINLSNAVSQSQTNNLILVTELLSQKLFNLILRFLFLIKLSGILWKTLSVILELLVLCWNVYI